MRLRDLVLFGIILIQPTAPMPLFGILSVESRGHAVSTLLLALVAMLFTAVSYGRMARVYPTAGSAYTYVGQGLHASLGYMTGWAMLMDYVLNPLICAVWCGSAAANIFPEVPPPVYAAAFALLFTALNLRGLRASASTNLYMAAGMSLVVVWVLGACGRYVASLDNLSVSYLLQPFYDPRTFSVKAMFTGTSIAVLTYIGFDGISTLSEEVENPRRNILLATVLTCVVTAVLGGLEVYAAQLVWPQVSSLPNLETAYVYVAGRAGGPILFHVLNLTLLIASVGSGTGSQFAAARLLYGMWRDGAIPKQFFAKLEPKHHTPRNNVLATGFLILIGSQMVSYQLGAELLNFGAFVGFMGVNLAVFVHYFVRKRERTAGNFFPPLLGFLVCFGLWLNLRPTAKLVGFAWLIVGIAYGAWRTRGFRRDSLTFELPAE